MHILLTDVLVCPRCGPGFGLILLANEMRGRRVVRGSLGCSNCRERNEVRDGVVVMTGGVHAHQGEGEGPGERAEGWSAMSAVKIAALLGVTGRAYVLLLGEAVAGAAEVAALVEEVEVIVVGGEGAAAAPAEGDGEWGVSRVVVSGGGGIPVATGKMSGVALLGARVDGLLEEAARVVRPTGRLLVDPAPADARERLAKVGLRVLAEEGSTLLAVRG